MWCDLQDLLFHRRCCAGRRAGSTRTAKCIFCGGIETQVCLLHDNPSSMYINLLTGVGKRHGPLRVPARSELQYFPRRLQVIAVGARASRGGVNSRTKILPHKKASTTLDSLVQQEASGVLRHGQHFIASLFGSAGLVRHLAARNGGAPTVAQIAVEVGCVCCYPVQSFLDTGAARF